MDDSESMDSAAVAKIVMSTIIYTVGTFGNILVIFMILYLGETKKISHWYILQLAVADVIFLQSLPFYMVDVTEGRFAHPAWFCTLKETVLYMNYYGSIIFLSIMAIDRYLAVCHGLSSLAKRFRSHRNCYIVTLVAWVVSFLLCIPVMRYADLNGECKCGIIFPADKQAYCTALNVSVASCDERFSNFLQTNKCIPENEPEEYSGSESSTFWSDYAEEDYMEVCIHSRIYPGLYIFIYYNFVAMFLLPVTIIAVCYGLIVLRLRNTNAKVRRNSERSDSTGHSISESSKLGRSKRRKSSTTSFSDKNKSRVTAVSAMLVVLFLVCWLPYHSVQLAQVPGYDSEIQCHVGETVTLLLVYVNSALNPYLYNFLGTFGKRMREIRKHRRTREILDSYRWTRMRSSSRRASNSFKVKKTNDGSLQITRISTVKDEASSTHRADSSSANENIHLAEH